MLAGMRRIAVVAGIPEPVNALVLVGGRGLESRRFDHAFVHYSTGSVRSLSVHSGGNGVRRKGALFGFSRFCRIGCITGSPLQSQSSVANELTGRTGGYAQK